MEDPGTVEVTHKESTKDWCTFCDRKFTIAEVRSSHRERGLRMYLCSECAASLVNELNGILGGAI